MGKYSAGEHRGKSAPFKKAFFVRKIIDYIHLQVKVNKRYINNTLSFNLLIVYFNGFVRFLENFEFLNNTRHTNLRYTSQCT